MRIIFKYATDSSILTTTNLDGLTPLDFIKMHKNKEHKKKLFMMVNKNSTITNGSKNINSDGTKNSLNPNEYAKQSKFQKTVQSTLSKEDEMSSDYSDSGFATPISLSQQSPNKSRRDSFNFKINIALEKLQENSKLKSSKDLQYFKKSDNEIEDVKQEESLEKSEF